MRWDDFRRSDNVEDDRGGGGFGGGGGGFGFPVGGGGLGIGTVVVLGLIGWALGIDPGLLISGAQILTGGKANDLFFEPTVIAGATNEMRAMREETFGPTLPIAVFRTEEEAIRLANDTEFGLTASVWTRDLAKGKRVAERIEAGTVCVNEVLYTHGIGQTPWGGFKKWFTPERSQNTQSLNGWILSRPSANAISSAVDAYPLLSCGEPERLCPELAAPYKDGLHFGKLGHQKLAKALLDGPFQGCQR